MIYLLLPAFNEADGIEILIKNIFKQLHNQQHSIIIVNDGSCDNTLNILEKLQSDIKLEILNHEQNLGLGRAILTGINHISATINENDILITMDADNTHPVELMQKLSENINNGNDIAIASRYASGGREIGLKKHRKILSSGAGIILKLFFPIKNVSDYTSGYRAYSGRIIKKALNTYGQNLITAPGFTCMAEILIKLSRIGASITETGLELRYDLKKGKSKIKILKTILSYFRLILRLKFEKI
ncbi:MAG: hypothetical protein A2551_00355 [Elusimicrobia bacterium RIFOXYD2_FULL_34_30]|nr:MAG: hypothetical protein A2551_00355 [Elusimicrobia bacterium RIFOXYD2_FULL_34_30]